jgi:hypothetical protein
VKTAGHITVPECAYFIEVRAIANDLFLAKRASRLFLSNVGKGVYSIHGKAVVLEENSRFPAHSVYDNRCGGALMPMQKHLRRRGWRVRY